MLSLLPSVFSQLEYNLERANSIKSPSPLAFWDCEYDNPEMTDKYGCFYQNPTSPYAAINPPRHPNASFDEGEERHWFYDNGEIDKNVNYEWRISTREFLIFFGKAPPPMRYFGIQHSLSTRHFFGKHKVFGSLGDPINHLTLCNGFDNPFIVVVSASSEAEQYAMETIEKSKVENNCTNSLRIPGNLEKTPVYTGLGRTDDTFTVLLRFAMPTEKFDDWKNDMPVSLYRVSIPDSSSATPHPLEPTTKRKEPKYDYELEARHTAKLNEIKGDRRYFAFPFQFHRGTVPENGASGCVGWLRLTNCQGDTRDANYRAALPIFTLDVDDYMMAVGVNHKVRGEAVYNNLVLYDLENNMGVATITDDDLGADDVFAVKIAHFCEGYEPCLKVPLQPGVKMTIVERIYLNPKSMTAPKQEGTIPVQLVLFSKKLENVMYWDNIRLYLYAIYNNYADIRFSPILFLLLIHLIKV